MNKFFNKVKYRILAGGVGMISLFLPFLAHAQATTSSTIADGIVEWVGKYMFSPIVGLLGNVALILINFLIKVVSYTGYMTSPAVTNGWTVVRDVANMFFVAMFLVIAIGTIVNPGRFQGIKAVSRLLLYAVFVNFSKLIVGICIDVSNLVMLTFVNGFKAAAGGNFVDALGMRQLVQLNPSEAANTTLPGLIGAQLLALVMMIIIVVLIGILLIAMVMRVVTLWFLVVISPLAFAMGGTEFTKSRYAEWWKRFSAQLTTGPLVAFFLWLTLATVQQQPNGADIAGTGPGSISGAQTSGAGTQLACSSNSFCQESQIMRFVIASLMLLGGLMFAKDFEGVGGELAGAAWKRGKDLTSNVGRRVAKLGMIGVGVAATGGIGAAAAGAYVFSRTQTGKGVVGRAGTGFGRTVSNLQQRRGVIGTMARVMPGLSMAGRAATTYGNKQFAEADKTARDRMQFLSPAQVEEIAMSPLSNYIDQRAAALRIAKDRDYRTAPVLNDDGTANRRYQALQNSARILSNIQGDKDATDASNELRDIRPDAFEHAAEPVNFTTMARGFNVRENANKLRLDLMPEAGRNQFLANMREDVLTDFYDRTNQRNKESIDAFRRGNMSSGTALDADIANHNIDVAHRPAERNVPGVLTPPGGRPTTQVDTDFARRVVEHGDEGQIRAFVGRQDINRFATALRDELRHNIDFRTGAGLTAGTNNRMTDENLRRAEAAVVTGVGIHDAYAVRRDGNFSDDTMRRSLEESLETPRRIDIVSRVDSALVSDSAAPGGHNELTYALTDHLTEADLSELANRADNPQDETRMRRILNAIEQIRNDGTQTALRRNRATNLITHAASDPNIARHLP